MVGERSTLYTLVDALIYGVLAVLAITCVVPFIYVIALSLSSKAAIVSESVVLWPVGFNVENYSFILRNSQFINSFGTSVMRVLVGVSVHLLVVVLTAYGISRDHLHLPGRTIFKAMLLIGMLFSGGLVPFFLTIRNLGLLNSFWVLILPPALSIFNVIVMSNFFRGLPHELEEAAVLDGANHLDILFRIFVPLSVPALATVGLFSAVGHWNAWFDGILFIGKPDQWPLQSFLYSLVSTRSIEWTSGAGLQQFMNATPKGLSAALVLFASLSILFVYPFVQRYFVTGLTLGAVKQ